MLFRCRGAVFWNVACLCRGRFEVSCLQARACVCASVDVVANVLFVGLLRGCLYRNLPFAEICIFIFDWCEREPITGHCLFQGRQANGSMLHAMCLCFSRTGIGPQNGSIYTCLLLGSILYFCLLWFRWETPTELLKNMFLLPFHHQLRIAFMVWSSP